MDKVKVRPLRPSEQTKLHRLKGQRTNAVNHCHARIVLLSRGGLRNRDIATRVGRSPQWVRRIIHRFNADGLDGITWFPFMQAPSRPRRFTTELAEQIAEVALCSPVALIGMRRWSLAKLRDYPVEQRVIAHISLEWLRTLLRRQDIRWRRTKTWKESTDPHLARKYRAIRRLYQRRPAGGRRLCVDAFGPLNLQPRHLQPQGRGPALSGGLRPGDGPAAGPVPAAQDLGAVFGVAQVAALALPVGPGVARGTGQLQPAHQGPGALVGAGAQRPLVFHTQPGI
jgi:transposase